MNLDDLLKSMSDDTKQLNSELLGTLKRAKQKGIATDAPSVSQPVEVFKTYWQVLGGPELVAEYKFDSTRRWRMDFVHLPSMTAIEVHGGVHSQGRHVRAGGFTKDRAKMNAAQAAGWTVFELPAPIDFSEVERIHKHIQRSQRWERTADGKTQPTGFAAQADATQESPATRLAPVARRQRRTAKALRQRGQAGGGGKD